MKNENPQKQEYCDAMNQIHAPEDLLRKVSAMNQQSKVKSFKLRKLAYAAAALGIIFVSSNAVTYAATGNTWIEKVIITINGEKQEVDAEFFEYNKDGTEYKGIELHVDDEASPVSIEYSEEDLPEETSQP